MFPRLPVGPPWRKGIVLWHRLPMQSGGSETAENLRSQFHFFFFFFLLLLLLSIAATLKVQPAR